MTTPLRGGCILCAERLRAGLFFTTEATEALRLHRGAAASAWRGERCFAS